MVVNPDSNTLLNRGSLPYWPKASNFSTSDALVYFEGYSPATPIPSDPSESPALKTALSSVDQFEQEQAQRIYTAYAALGRLLKSMQAGQASPGFKDKWGNLAKMRTTITGDLGTLRASAVKQDAGGVTNIKLDYPS